MATRTVSRLVPPRQGWTVPALLAHASAPSLVCFDAPLGLPRSYLQATGYSSFVEWLARAPFETLFAPVTGPEDWSLERPFVRPVAGGWTAVVQKSPVSLWREVDLLAGAESVFKLIGAKQVGRAAQELWQELRDARVAGASFRIWPFETDLEADDIVVAEIYPKTAYEEVLGPVRFVKTDGAARAEVLRGIAGGITIADLPAAAATDDDFDAAVTAAALLRRTVSRVALVGGTVDPVFEGGILCA